MENSAIVPVNKLRLRRNNTSGDEIKVFAESTMNELLGWYGYDATKDRSKLSRNARSNSGSNDSEADSVKFTEGCGWCGKPVDENNGLTSGTAEFCSELCFSQSRRANFKKNKVCDWCRHVRHTVTYVDFQDGVSQLQFCSDKCLNQYKMQIFCRETRAHLELHPHLLGNTDATSGALITPDLWLRNCRSPSPIPQRPPSPQTSAQNQIAQTSSLPFISVAHPSKLLANHDKKRRASAKSVRRNKRRCSSTITSENLNHSSNDVPQDLRIKHTPPRELPASFGVAKDILAIVNGDSINSKIISDPLDTSNLKEEKGIPQESAKVPDSTVKTILNNLLPPQTVFVPYPVILPLPMPIPIPIPIPKMIKLYNNKEMTEIKNAGTQTDDPSNNEAPDNNVITTSCVRKSLRKRKRILLVDQRKKLAFRSKKSHNNNLQSKI